MTDRIALVTGCSRGVGAALCGVLLDRGWLVHGVARGDVPSELSDKGLVHHRVDLADLARVEATFHADFATDLGLADARQVALVNNAGVLAMAPTQGLDLTELDAAIRINVTAPTWLMGWFVRNTSESARLDLVNLSSGAAANPYPGWLAYCTSKAALRMAGRTVAADVTEQPGLEGRAIHVLDFAPGVVATDMQAEVRAADPATFPRRERFHELRADGDLVLPVQPATEIADLLERTDPPVYDERRLGS